MLFPNTKFIRTFKDPIDCDRFYFGYGSNVNNQIMSKRCPGAIPLGIGAITNMKFTINKLGVATLLPKSNFMSYGILWIINEKHERNLDKIEGVKRNYYYREYVEVNIGKAICKSLIYFACDEKNGTAKNGYIQLILDGINFFDGHKNWYNEIQSFK